MRRALVLSAVVLLSQACSSNPGTSGGTGGGSGAGGGTGTGGGGAAMDAGHDAGVPPLGVGEPTYDAGYALILRDNFDQYANFTAANAAYPTGRAHEYVELIPGRGASGKALRLKYGVPDGGDDILLGTENRLDMIGRWNGTLPERAGPYTHFLFSTWFRTTAGANPAENNASGIKGFMFWHGMNYNGGRYEQVVNQLSHPDSQTRGPKGCNPDNAASGLNLYKTTDGRAPLWSLYANGDWHRFTIEIFAGNDPSGHFGERYWVDGQLIYSDLDIPVGGGTAADHYSYPYAVGWWAVWGNFVNDTNARSSFFNFDIDDWIAWTDKP